MTMVQIPRDPIMSMGDMAIPQNLNCDSYSTLGFLSIEINLWERGLGVAISESSSVPRCNRTAMIGVDLKPHELKAFNAAIELLI